MTGPDGASDLESFGTDRDELRGPSERRRGFKRPRIEWELVSSWNKDHIAQEDYEGEIARIMKKSLWDSKTAVSPKYNAKAISDFRFKTARTLRFYYAHSRLAAAGRLRSAVAFELSPGLMWAAGRLGPGTLATASDRPNDSESTSKSTPAAFGMRGRLGFPPPG